MTINWHRQHKWSSIAATLFIILFCLSGIVLNHRDLVRDVGISRSVLPPFYRYENWSGGLMRGSMPIASPEGVAVYGTGGIWLADRTGSGVSDFNAGLPDAPDHRQVRAMATTPDRTVWALTTTCLYRLTGTAWRPVGAAVSEDAFTDMTVRGDSLVVMSRSGVMVALPPYRDFVPVALSAPADAADDVSAFRFVWLLHSGELFGLTGRLVVDAIALVMILLSVTGLMIWLLPKAIRRRRHAVRLGRITGSSLTVHRKVGVATVALTLAVCVTGWCLRPPVLIPLALCRVPAISGTTLCSDNHWHDKLRMIRYDDEAHEWLISTSDGFYALEELDGVPVEVARRPPVSVMGLNVFERQPDGSWFCGSFSSMYEWHRGRDTVLEWPSGTPVADNVSGPPFGKLSVAGYTADFGPRGAAVTYDGGTTAVAQPEELRNLPMSLWNVALEVHTGRIFIGASATYIYVFVIGLLAVWCIVSGYMAAKGRRRSYNH